MCDVKPGECGPWRPQKIQDLVQTHSVYDSKAEECILTGSPKQDVARGLLTMTRSQGAAPLITTSNPGMAGHRLKRADWTPAGDLCQGHTPFLSAKGYALISLLWGMSGMAPVSCRGAHPSSRPIRTQTQGALSTKDCRHSTRWQVKSEHTQGPQGALLGL